MVIEIPGCKFRIKGEALDWQIQYPQARKDGGTSWNGKYFFPSLSFAIGKAYEMALRESDVTVDISEVRAECERVKDMLVQAVREAVAQ